MRGFLTKIVQRQLRRIALGATLGMALAMTSTVVTTTPAYDTNLDVADLAAERAQILLAGADCGLPDGRSTEKCERHMRKALALLASVREAITRPTSAAQGIRSAQPVRN
jgi:type VI protein secretion system component VasK